jgi:hypothetical protein
MYNHIIPIVHIFIGNIAEFLDKSDLEKRMLEKMELNKIISYEKFGTCKTNL